MIFDDDLALSERNIRTLKSLDQPDGMKELKEFISGEMERILLVKDDADPIWLLKTDMLMDYSSYFQTDNPKNLVYKIYTIKKKRMTRFKTV